MSGAERPPAKPAPSPPTTPAPLFSRRYGWMVGVLATALVIGFALYTLSSHAAGTAGVPAGQALPAFSAPLAASTLDGDANLRPPCTVAHHDRRALNLCLLVTRGPLVLAFFVVDSATCERLVDAVQALATQPAMRHVRFAAIAVHASHRAAAKVVRARGWTIPVAYDADGSVGGLYGVTACPLLEVAQRGGTVTARLIGKHWTGARALSARVRTALGLAGTR